MGWSKVFERTIGVRRRKSPAGFGGSIVSPLSHSMGLSTFSRSNVVVVALVVASVVALFFLPEIIDLKRAVSNTQDAVVAGAGNEESAPVALESSGEEITRVRAVTAPSPLEEVLLLLDAGNEPRASASLPLLRGEISAKGEVPPTETTAPRGEVAESLESLTTNPLTWNAIQSDASGKALRKARSDALELARSLGARHQNTRHALFNFASGIGFTLDPKATKLMNPEEAVGYLERLDNTVSRSMSRESVDRLDYQTWAGISLGPVLQSTRLGRRDLPPAPRFNPHLTISSVYVLHTKPDDARSKRLEDVNVFVTGFVRGKDAHTVKFVDESGRVRRRIRLRKPRADTDYRFFKSSRIDGRRTWTIMVEGPGDEVYSKIYRFHDRAVQFGWGRVEQARANGYLLPFRNVRATPRDFDPALVDPRLDAHFHIGGYELRTEHGFQTF